MQSNFASSPSPKPARPPAVPGATSRMSRGRCVELMKMVKSGDDEKVQAAMESIWTVILEQPTGSAQSKQCVDLAKEALVHFTRLPPSPSFNPFAALATLLTLGALASTQSLDKARAAKYLSHALECVTTSPQATTRALGAMHGVQDRIPARFAPAIVKALGGVLRPGVGNCNACDFVSVLAALHKNHGVPVQRSYQRAAASTILAAAFDLDRKPDLMPQVMQAFQDLTVICPARLCLEVLKQGLMGAPRGHDTGALMFYFNTCGAGDEEGAEEVMDMLIPCAVRVLALGAPVMVAYPAQLVLAAGARYQSVEEMVMLAPGSSPEVNSGYVLWMAKQAVKKTMMRGDYFTPSKALACLECIRDVPDAWTRIGPVIPELMPLLLGNLGISSQDLSASLAVVAKIIQFNPTSVRGHEVPLALRLLTLLLSGRVPALCMYLCGSLQILVQTFAHQRFDKLFVSTLDRLGKLLVDMHDPDTIHQRWLLLVALSYRFTEQADKWMLQCLPQALVCIKVAAFTGALQPLWVNSALAIITALARRPVIAASRYAVLDACLQLCESTPAKNCYCTQSAAWEACAELAWSIAMVPGSLQPLASRALRLMAKQLSGQATPRAPRGCDNTLGAQHGLFGAAAQLLPRLGGLAALREELRVVATAVVTCLASPARCPVARGEDCQPVFAGMFQCPSHCTAAVGLAAALISHPTIHPTSREQLIQSLLDRAGDGNHEEVRGRAIVQLSKVVREGYFTAWISKFLDVLLLGLRSGSPDIVAVSAQAVTKVYSQHPSPNSHTPHLAKALRSLLRSRDASMAGARPMITTALASIKSEGSASRGKAQGSKSRHAPRGAGTRGSGHGQGQGSG